jgi:hypothetical protein
MMMVLLGHRNTPNAECYKQNLLVLLLFMLAGWGCSCCLYVYTCVPTLPSLSHAAWVKLSLKNAAVCLC